MHKQLLWLLASTVDMENGCAGLRWTEMLFEWDGSIKTKRQGKELISTDTGGNMETVIRASLNGKV